MIDFTYLCQPPARYTFEQPQLKAWVEKWCKGKVLNLFAGMIKLDVDEYRVDMDSNAPADHHGDAFEFVNTTTMKFDTVLLDPPYNLRKSREKYGSRYIGSFTKIKEVVPRILNDGGRVIILGYDTVGMAHRRDFKKLAICVVCHNGDHNDTLCTVEQKIHQDIRVLCNDGVELPHPIPQDNWHVVTIEYEDASIWPSTQVRAEKGRRFQ